MARVTPMERADFDERLRTRTASLEEVELGHLRMFAHSPDVALAWLDFIGGVNAASTLSRRLVELVRLRIAFHNQCPHCMAIRFEDGVRDGIDETLVCSLEKPEQAADLSPAERAALTYADLTATNHFAVDDATYAMLRQHFSERSSSLASTSRSSSASAGFRRAGSTPRTCPSAISTRRPAASASRMTPC